METYSLCCWLEVSQQPIPQLILSSKKLLLQPCIISRWQPQTSFANSQQTPTPQILLLAIDHVSRHFTCRLLCIVFAGKIFKLFATSNPTTSSPHILFLLPPLMSQFSLLPKTPQSTRSCPTVQPSNLTQIPFPHGFSKNVHRYLFPQSTILFTSL